jgi:hypothetical protein
MAAQALQLSAREQHQLRLGHTLPWHVMIGGFPRWYEPPWWPCCRAGGYDDPCSEADAEDRRKKYREKHLDHIVDPLAAEQLATAETQHDTEETSSIRIMASSDDSELSPLSATTATHHDHPSKTTSTTAGRSTGT